MNVDINLYQREKKKKRVDFETMGDCGNATSHIKIKNFVRFSSCISDLCIKANKQYPEKLNIIGWTPLYLAASFGTRNWKILLVLFIALSFNAVIIPIVDQGI